MESTAPPSADQSQISPVESQIEPTATPEATLPARENPTFKNAIWGDNKETVKDYETETLEEEDDDSLCYSANIVNIEAFLFYDFNADDQLYRAVYMLQNNHTTDQMYITDYNSLKSALIEKYGEPETDTRHILSDLANYTDEAGALSLGYAAYETAWPTNEDTKIYMFMSSDNYVISTAVFYESLTIEEPADTSGL
jgi:hypothetical protein